MAKLVLYSYFRSSAAYRVRIALNLKNIEHEICPVHLLKNGGEQHKPTYRKTNPQGLIPALECPDRTTITQSLAIIEYLEEKYPEPALISGTPEQRAQQRAVAQAICCDIHPLNNLRVLNFLQIEMGLRDTQKQSWYHHWIKEGLDALETMIANKGHQHTFCFGEQPSVADICLAPQMYNAKRFNCDIDNYPTLQKIYDNCMELESFRLAAPEMQADHEES